MESEQGSDWRPASQDIEQPDEHGLCWRETEIGLLAFKTNEDGTRIWIQFDSNGNGTQVIFDEAGQAFYVDGEMTTPVPLPKSQQLPQEYQPREYHKSDIESQETFGKATTASQLELIADTCTADEVRTNPQLKLSGREPASFAGNVSKANSEKGKTELQFRPNQEPETGAVMHTQLTSSSAESEFLDPSSSVEAGDREATKKGALHLLKSRALVSI